jgi:hypothetical protein
MTTQRWYADGPGVLPVLTCDDSRILCDGFGWAPTTSTDMQLAGNSVFDRVISPGLSYTADIEAYGYSRDEWDRLTNGAP